MSEPGWVRHLPAEVAPTSVDLLSRTSLPAAWSENWSRAPDREVIRDVDGTSITAGELLQRTESLARRLRGTGLERGDRVMVSGPTSGDYVVAHCAALRAGLVVTPVNPDYSRRELEVLLSIAAPKAAFVESREMTEWIRESAAECLVLGLDVSLPSSPSVPVGDVSPGDPALLPFTSGTTGVPKGAPLSHANLLAGAEALRLAWRWTPEDRLILCLPLFHMHGLGVGLHGTLLTGASAILLSRFDPEDVLTLATQDATMFFGVPTMYGRMAAANGADRLSRLRLCVSGSAPMSADLHGEVEAKCGQSVLERYGTTETLMLVSNPFEGERRAGAVGFPLPGVDLRLASESSEIEVRGPNVFGGYLDRPEANADAFSDDGWFRTGDVGAFDQDGYLSIVGRTKELIITGGYNVYPREIEDLLVQHPTVLDAAVVGTPSDEWGEIVTAFVVATDDFDQAELVDWASAQLAPYKKPRLVYRVESIPRNHLGKILRDQLGQ